MIKELKIADYITLLSLVSGLASIYYSLYFNYQYAVIAIFISVILDGLDGIVARLMKQQHRLGEQLDSLADLIAFGIAPSILVFMLGNIDAIALAIISFYVVASALRLAYFNASIGKNKGFFTGLPTTASGLLTAASILIAPKFAIWVMLLTAILMLSPFKLRKWSF